MKGAKVIVGYVQRAFIAKTIPIVFPSGVSIGQNRPSSFGADAPVFLLSGISFPACMSIRRGDP